MKLAYMSVQTEIMAQKVANSTYDATDNTTTDSQGKTNVEKIKDIVKNDLNAVEGTSQAKDFGVEIGTNPDDASKPAIKIVYKNSKIYQGTIATNKPKENGQVEYYITLEPQSAGLVVDGVTVAEVSEAGTGGSGTGGSEPTSPTGPSEDYTALRVGDTVYYKDASNNDIECTVLYDSTGSYGVQIIPRNSVTPKKQFKSMFEDDEDDKAVKRESITKNPIADKRLSFLFED